MKFVFLLKKSFPIRFTNATLLITTFLWLGLGYNNALGQAKYSTKSKKAIQYYNESDNFRVRGQYGQAIGLLSKALQKDDEFVEAYIRLGIIYKAMKDTDAAAKSFEKAISLKPDDVRYGIAYFYAGELYLQLNDYEKALDRLKKFTAYKAGSRAIREHARELVGNAEFGLKNDKVVADFSPRRLPDVVNAFPMQYFPVLTVDQKTLIYTMRRGTTSEYDEDLVVCTKSDDGEWSRPETLSRNINSRFNEGTCTISADGRTLIFTSCFGRKGYGSCDLYISHKTGKEWSSPENMGRTINSSSWDSQPSLSPDGRTLYFVSNRAGGKGGSRDIWMTQLQEDNTWSVPESLDRSINTEKDEVSPFIHANNKTLYFSSNGRPGFGGFDIYHSEKTEEGWKEAVNLGKPVNTGEDQVSLFITADGKKGYYSLENLQKPTVKGELYEFDVPESIQVKYKSNFVMGNVYDADTKKPLKAIIELFDLNNQELVSLVYSDEIEGDYKMVLTEGSEYALYIDKKGYLFKSLSFSYLQHKHLDPIQIDVYLRPVKKGTKVVLENIFFDVDKYDIKEKSKTELNKMVRFLKSNPSVEVEIGGHTDNTGSPTYNRSLSLKRAKAVYEYLINNGVTAKKLSYKGYGMTQPLVPNDSESNKKQNRRIEFQIVYTTM